jgi:hypothetical protein
MLGYLLAIRPASYKILLCSFSCNERDDNIRVEDVRNTAQERQRVALVARLFDRRDRLDGNFDGNFVPDIRIDLLKSDSGPRSGSTREVGRIEHRFRFRKKWISSGRNRFSHPPSGKFRIPVIDGHSTLSSISKSSR